MTSNDKSFKGSRQETVDDRILASLRSASEHLEADDISLKKVTVILQGLMADQRVVELTWETNVDGLIDLGPDFEVSSELG